MKIFEIARYERDSSIWANARTDKKTHHYVEMLCSVVDYDAQSAIEAEYGWAPC